MVLFGLERESIKGSFQKVKTNPKHLSWGGGCRSSVEGRGERLGTGLRVGLLFEDVVLKTVLGSGDEKDILNANVSETTEAADSKSKSYTCFKRSTT